MASGFALAIIPASADSFYYYTGANYTFATAPYTTSMNISGYFSVTSPLPDNSYIFVADPIVGPWDIPLTSWQFTDGVHTFDASSDLGVTGFFEVYATTNATGEIVDWEISIYDPNASEGTGSCGPGPDCGTGAFDYATDYAPGDLAEAGNNAAGTWSETPPASPIPEPPYLGITLCTLTAGLLIRERRRRNAMTHG
jgi:hypothetical protein